MTLGIDPVGAHEATSMGSIFVLLFVVASLVAILSRRLRLPYTVALVLAGLALGSANALAAPALTRELLFAVFLPGLVFEAALHIPYADFRANGRAIGLLAIPGVLLGAALVTLLLVPVGRLTGVAPDITWASAAAFASLISATDPIAVVALFKQLGAPKRLVVLLDAESLVNDGTAVVLFTIVLGVIAGQSLSVIGAVLQFVGVVGMGVAIGLAVGFAITWLVRITDDPMVEITLTTVAAFGSFLVAENVGGSGIIATMATGMVIGNATFRRMSPDSRVAVTSFWEYVAFAMNSVVFLLIGFSVRLSGLVAAWPAILLAYAVITIARAALVGGVKVALRRSTEALPDGWGRALTWGGLRGALAMVLALSLPASVPSRDRIVTVTFGVVLLTILLQGVTMPALLGRWLALGREESRG